ncbi:MAG: hypothetical protein OXH84_04560 [Gammaproteobacteria bacterium]|nr:hypothetical protein [Gammaproteobacteria bacterium]
MTKENSSTPSRGLFFAVVLMGALVILTVVGYFLWLPNLAPKLITLAILPFEGDETTPDHLKYELPRFLTMRLSESRDLNIVDFYDTREWFETGEVQFQTSAIVLGATHLLVGEFKSVADTDEFDLEIKLVDVSKVSPSMKWESTFSSGEQSILEIHNEIVTDVREKLYDKSPLAPLEEELNSASFEHLLRAYSLVSDGRINDAAKLLLAENHQRESAHSSYLLSQLLSTSRAQYVERALKLDPNHYLALIENVDILYERDQDFLQYLDNVTKLASRYPNSKAVSSLARIYHELGWFAEEQELLYRVSRIQPLSSEVALRIAFSRFHTEDHELVTDALQIAQLREPSDEQVTRYRELFDWNLLEQRNDVGANEYLRLIQGEYGYSNLASMPSNLIQKFTCDELVELALYLDDFDGAFDALSCSRRLWLQPPPFWNEDEPQWVSFVGDDRYSQWLQAKGLDLARLAELTPPVVRKLFIPKRRYLWSPKSESE